MQWAFDTVRKGMKDDTGVSKLQKIWLAMRVTTTGQKEKVGCEFRESTKKCLV